MQLQHFKKQSGFTMIELIVVIVIIGILAAIAVPRFINQTSNARIAALNGLAGAINSAAELAQTEYVAEGYNNSSTATSITMNGTTVTVIAKNGAPAGSAAGIGAALQTVTGFTPTYVAGPPGVATYNFSPSVSSCNLTYTDQVTGPPLVYGVVAITSTGC